MDLMWYIVQLNKEIAVQRKFEAKYGFYCVLLLVGIYLSLDEPPNPIHFISKFRSVKHKIVQISFSCKDHRMNRTDE